MENNKLKALELKKEGNSQNEIQRILGLSRGIISKWKNNDSEFKKAWEEISGNNDGITKRNNSGISKKTKEGNNIGIPKEYKPLFSSKEVLELRELLRVKDKLIDIAKGNNKGITTLNIDRSNRKKATFNMDMELLEELKKYEGNSTISKSDVVNIALRQYLNNNGITKE